jgi:hypothetical protein
LKVKYSNGCDHTFLVGGQKMKRILSYYILILISIPSFHSRDGFVNAQTNYYISSSTGSDLNTGTINNPWATPFKIHSITLQPGDSVFFKRGDVWEGNFEGTFAGNAEHPIYIGAYGIGELPVLLGDIRGRTWIPIPGRPGIFKCYLGGHCFIGPAFRQWLNGAWKRSINNANWSASSSNAAFLNSFTEGSEGSNSINGNADTLFIHTWNNISISQNISRDSLRFYRYGNQIGPNSHDVIVENLDLRNYYIPIVSKGNEAAGATFNYNITFRNLVVRNGTSSGMRLITTTKSLVEHCVFDSSGDSGMYLVQAHQCIVRNNLVTNVLRTIDGGIDDGVDLCGVGILDNYAYNRAKDTIGYNTVEYNKFYNIYDSFTDWFYCLGDTVRYNEGHEAGTAGSPMGDELVFTHNTFTMRSATGGNGSNIGSDHGNITYTYNTLDSIKDFALWIEPSGLGSGTYTINHNTFRLIIPARTFIDYKTATGITSTDNIFYGTGDNWKNGTTIYSNLASLQAATGYEAGSTWYSGVGAPTGTFIGTPDTLPLNGGTVRLKWTSDAISAAISPSIGIVATNDSIETDTIYTTTIFVLTLTGALGSTTTYSKQVIVKTNPIEPPQPGALNYFLEPYPNPSNGSTIIEFIMPNDGIASLKVYDTLGRQVTTLANGQYSRGIHRFSWNIGDLASGVYYCKFISGSYNQIHKMIVLR